MKGLVLIAILCLITGHAHSAAPLDENVGGNSWRRYESQHFSLYAPVELSEDGVRVLELVGSAIEALAHEFESAGGVGLLSGVELVVVLYPSPNDRVDTGRSLSETRGERVQLSFLSPSRYRTNARNSAGEPFTDAAWLHQITHELVSTFSQRATMQKPSGWVYFQAPNWFMQGYEEYLGHKLSPGGAERTEHLRAVLAEHAYRLIWTGEQLELVNPYLQGLFLVKLLHDRYGSGFALQLFANPASDFWGAMNSEFGLVPEILVKIWNDV